MSRRQDRLTFFGVLAAVVVVVLGYLQLGQLYPTTGRTDASQATPDELEGGDEDAPQQGLDGEGEGLGPDGAAHQEDASPEG